MPRTFYALLIGSALSGSPAIAATAIPPIMVGAPSAAEINKRCDWFAGEKIAQELAGSVLLGGGQFCTKPGIIFTVGEDTKFVSALAENISKAAAPTMLNAGLRENFCGRISSFEQVAGVKKIAEGKPQGHAQMGPTLFETSADVWRSNDKLHEEAFGPGALVVHCKNLQEAADCIDAIEGSLTGTVHTGSSDAAYAAVRHRGGPGPRREAATTAQPIV